MYRPIASGLIIASLFLYGLAAAADDIHAAAQFSESEIAIIHDYYARHASAAQPPDGKKAKRLPPGIAKNLQRGKPLPPGIAKRYLPGELQDALPPAPEGYERVVTDEKILLIEIATQVVADVLTGVLSG